MSDQLRTSIDIGHQPSDVSDEERARRFWLRMLWTAACLIAAVVLTAAGTVVLVGRDAVGPASVAGPSPAPPKNRYGAPIPTAPRDVRPLARDVCGAISEAQWRELGFEPNGQFRTDITGWPSCKWRGIPDPRWVRILGSVEAASSERVDVSATATNDDLVGAYHSHMEDIFTPTTIGGLPALVEQSSVNRSSCDVTVGTDVGAGLFVIYDQPIDPDTPDPENACPKARRITEAIVVRLPPMTR